MAESIGSLNVKIGLDSAQFSTGLKKSQTELSGFAKTAGIAGAAIGAALAGTAIAAGAAIKGAIDRADQLDELSQKIGVGVEELSRLQYAAEISGVSVDTLTVGIKKLSAGLAEAAGKGTGAAADALDALGISAVDATGKLRDGDEVLVDIAEKFAGMEDGAGKTALAMKLFGKSGADLIPLLNEGKDGIARLKAEADALGITLSAEAAAAAGKFNENLDRLKATSQGVATQLMGATAPALLSISESLIGVSQNTELMDGLGKGLAVTLRSLASAGVIVAAAFSATGKTIAAVSKAIGFAIKGDFASAGAMMNTQAVDLDAVAKSVMRIWSDAPGTPRAEKKKKSDDMAAPLVDGAKKIKAAGDDAAKAAKEANDKIREAYDRAHDSLLTDDERYLKGWRERIKALDDARAADLISYERYLDEIERLNIERDARAFKPVGDPGNVSFIPIDNNPVLDTKLGDMIAGLEEAARAADEVAYSIDDIYFGFKNNNWTQAVSGLLRAVQSVQKAFATGNSMDKFSAVAGVAQGVGSAIGGKAGGALSGAASGAMAGLSVGGLPGAAIGAVIGGIAGIFGASSAKKKAKKEAEERARQAEAERVARVEAARKTLEIELMRVSGDTVGALAKSREYELAAMDASLHEQQKAIWAAEDLAEAQAKLTAISATRRDLEIELMQAMGDSAGAIAAQREALLSSLDESLRPLQSAVWGVIDANDALTKSQEAVAAAQDLVREAYDREASAFRETIDRFKGIGASLRDYAASIGAAEDGTMSLTEAAQRFAKVSAAARLGDSDAMSNLQSVSDAFRSAGRGQAKTLLEQLRIDAQVRAAAEATAATAERQASIAEQQLNALTQQLPANLREIDVTFSEGMAALNAAMAVESDLQLVANAHLADIAKSNPFTEIAAMRADLNAGLAAIAKGTSTTAAVLQRVTRDGEGMVSAA